MSCVCVCVRLSVYCLGGGVAYSKTTFLFTSHLNFISNSVMHTHILSIIYLLCLIIEILSSFSISEALQMHWNWNESQNWFYCSKCCLYISLKQSWWLKKYIKSNCESKNCSGIRKDLGNLFVQRMQKVLVLDLWILRIALYQFVTVGVFEP